MGQKATLKPISQRTLSPQPGKPPTACAPFAHDAADRPASPPVTWLHRRRAEGSGAGLRQSLPGSLSPVDWAPPAKPSLGRAVLVLRARDRPLESGRGEGVEADTVLDQHADKEGWLLPGFSRAHLGIEWADHLGLFAAFGNPIHGGESCQAQGPEFHGPKPIVGSPDLRTGPERKAEACSGPRDEAHVPVPDALGLDHCLLVEGEAESSKAIRREDPSSLRRSGRRSRSSRDQSKRPTTRFSRF